MTSPVILTSVELPADSQKLKRHIALLCDRISKGGSLGGRKEEGGSPRDGREVSLGSNVLHDRSPRGNDWNDIGSLLIFTTFIGVHRANSYHMVFHAAMYTTYIP